MEMKRDEKPDHRPFPLSASLMRSKRKKRFRNRGRKGIYILPNLITSAGLFGGFYAIISTIQGKFEAAAIAVIISAFFDAMDGRIARLTHTTSHFGTEYDSLSDVIAFGLAPGILAFEWALAPFGRLGWLAAFMFVACGALRLARFNVQKGTQDPNYFKGLPIPIAACFIASMVLFSSKWEEAFEGKPVIILVTVFILAFLMVSTITYFSFKKFDFTKRKPLNVLVSAILLFVIIASDPKVMLFLIILSFVLSGPMTTLYRLYRKRPLTKGLEIQHPSDDKGREGTSNP
jgi:CDP-diacylglycerol--serine O-phosphatidyltransferase